MFRVLGASYHRTWGIFHVTFHSAFPSQTSAALKLPLSEERTLHDSAPTLQSPSVGASKTFKHRFTFFRWALWDIHSPLHVFGKSEKNNIFPSTKQLRLIYLWSTSGRFVEGNSRCEVHRMATYNSTRKKKLTPEACGWSLWCLTELPGRILGCSDKYDVNRKQVAQSMPRPPLMVREWMGTIPRYTRHKMGLSSSH